MLAILPLTTLFLLLTAPSTSTPQSGLFTISTAPNAESSLSSKPVNACGRHFNVGGSTCQYCPPQVGICSSFSNETVVDGGGGMGSTVPGGQRYYLEQATGALGFTQAHSAALPAGGAIQSGFSAQEHGLFEYVGDGAGGWFACPAGGAGGWGVFQGLQGVRMPGGCLGVEIRVGGSSGRGVWQYT